MSASTNVSSAFFNVPTSLAGPNTPRAIRARTVASDGWVKSSVERFYGTVRAQVRFGADVAQGLKSLLLDLEEVKIADEFLLDSQTNLTHTSPDGRKFNWTTEGGGTFFLEIWAAGGNKSLELRFTKSESHFVGTAVASPTDLGWAEPVSPAKNPDWIQAEFDTDHDGLGTARLVISLQGFRYHADLNPGLENGSFILTKDAAGVVRLGSIIRGDNSQHFIWNGYLMNSSNQEVLNSDPAVIGETRYYVAAGAANSSNRATVHLGIPKTTVDATVFTGNGIGTLVSQLLADRLNNNYDFDNSAGQNTLRDEGHELIALLNTVNVGGGPQLDATTYSNTAAAVLAALQAAQTTLGASPNDYVDYLVEMMFITNPAYFSESTYQSYGATVPTGWPALITETDARALLPTQPDVDSMNILFENTAAPDF